MNPTNPEQVMVQLGEELDTSEDSDAQCEVEVVKQGVTEEHSAVAEAASEAFECHNEETVEMNGQQQQGFDELAIECSNDKLKSPIESGGENSVERNAPTKPNATTTPPPQVPQTQQLLAAPSDTSTPCSGEESQVDFDDNMHPLSERWSPLGANYDDALSPSSELLSPESEMEQLSSDSQEKADIHTATEKVADISRLRCMEEEQELLTSSLMALTSHFAHVQLRVRQIVEAPTNERDQLLKDLEEFAFRGIPEPLSAATTATAELSEGDSAIQQRQFELIDHLKTQLTELEKLAYESGAPVLPQHILLEKQKIIIDELKRKLNLKVEEHDLPELSAEELKCQVDSAIGEFVGPLKMKEQLVAQLKTQIADLERFIAFLQCDTDDGKLKTLAGSEKPSEAYNSYAAKKKNRDMHQKPLPSGEEDTVRSLNDNSFVGSDGNPPAEGSGVRESLHSKAHGLMDKASLLMQMFATTHFGAKPEQFQKNTLKRTNKGNHWGDLRAQLEVDIQEVASLAATLSFDREKLAKMKRILRKTKASSTPLNGTLTTTVPPGPPVGSRCRSRPISQSQHELKHYLQSSDSDEEDSSDCYGWQKAKGSSSGRRLASSGRFRGDSIETLSRELTTAVRKNFAMTLQRLIQHGLRVETESATSSLIVPFMRCLNPSPVFVAEHSFRARDGYSSPYGIDEYEDSPQDESSEGGFFGSGHSRPMHAWELILEYYYLKHGDEYNNTPARKLSQSFNLDIIDSQSVTAKQSLLSTVGMIIAMHRPYKRSYNAHFKAFVCAGLNSHQLVEWLNLIFNCSDLIETYYTASSYVARTGFRDSLRSIETLAKYDFDLPVDLAIRHFRNL